MEVLKFFAQECSNDGLGLTFTFSVARSNLLSVAFIWENALKYKNSKNL